MVKIGLFIEYTSENGTPDIEYTITEKTVNLYILSSDFDKYRGKVSVSQTPYHKEKRFQWEAKNSVPNQREKVVSNHNGTTTHFLGCFMFLV